MTQAPLPPPSPCRPTHGIAAMCARGSSSTGRPARTPEIIAIPGFFYARRSPMSDLAPVAAKGDRLTTLRALRDRLATELDETASARDVAALAARLTDVLEQIEDLTPPEEENRDEFDDLLDAASAG